MHDNTYTDKDVEEVVAAVGETGVTIITGNSFKNLKFWEAIEASLKERAKFLVSLKRFEGDSIYWRDLPMWAESLAREQKVLPVVVYTHNVDVIRAITESGLPLDNLKLVGVILDFETKTPFVDFKESGEMLFKLMQQGIEVR